MSQNMNYCDRARVVLLRNPGEWHPSKLFLIRCNDWRRCDYCANARRAKQWGRLKDLLRSIDMVNWQSYRVALITLTLDGKLGQRYGLEGRKNLAKAINRVNTFLRRRLKYPCLLKLRATEHHRNGAWHSHIVIVMDKRDYLVSKEIEMASGLGLVGVTYPTPSGTTRSPANGQGTREQLAGSINYAFKYVMAIEKDFVARAFHVKGTRYFAWSLSPLLRNLMRSSPSWQRKRQRYKRVYISKLKGRLPLWKRILSSYGVSYQQRLALLEPGSRPWLHLNKDGSATPCRQLSVKHLESCNKLAL